jgi:hypothetical protein
MAFNSKGVITTIQPKNVPAGRYSAKSPLYANGPFLKKTTRSAGKNTIAAQRLR